MGSDAAVAELLGLNEREVRLARRTVGKTDARSLAGALLTRAPADAPDTGGESEVATGDGDSTPAAADSSPAVAARPASPRAPVPAPRLEQSPPRRPTGVATAGPRVEDWSRVRDSFLVDGWNKGVDAATLASQLGIGLTQLVTRAQQLYAEGRLVQVRRDGGRHRRSAEASASSRMVHDYERALGPSAGMNHAWQPPAVDSGTGQQEAAHYLPYAQGGSAFTGYPPGATRGGPDQLVHHGWSPDHAADR
ncbi:hypothetical protein ABZ371_14065 [Streptomyces sp. NPDC005899]|uniref:hypothetical protein n=1 Tax=Streptomyces sp. NPDC005899 TaxID=3155716 RepID=UPI0033F92209